MKKTVLPLLLAMSALTSYSQYTEINNGGMEDWRPLTVGVYSLETPDQWCGTDSLLAAIAPLTGGAINPVQQLFKDNLNVHDGQYAAKIVSANSSDTLVIPGGLVNAQLSFDVLAFIGSGADPSQMVDFLVYDGGTLVNDQVDTVSAWVNADPANSEPAGVVVMAVIDVQGSEGDSMVVVGEGSLSIGSTDGYQQVYVPLTYEDPNVIPERLLVFFSSSDIDADQITAGNSLLVDGVSYSLRGSSSILPVTRDAKLVKVYPVPATEQVKFELKGDFRNGTLNVFDVQGRLIRTESVEGGSVHSLQVADWAKGTYYFRLENAKSGLLDRGSFVLN